MADGAVRDLHVGHVQLDVLDTVDRIAPSTEHQVVSDTGGDRLIVRGAMRALTQRGLMRWENDRWRLSELGARALERSRCAGREPGVPYSGPRKYSDRGDG